MSGCDSPEAAVIGVWTEPDARAWSVDSSLPMPASAWYIWVAHSVSSWISSSRAGVTSTGNLYLWMISVYLKSKNNSLLWNNLSWACLALRCLRLATITAAMIIRNASHDTPYKYSSITTNSEDANTFTITVLQVAICTNLCELYCFVLRLVCIEMDTFSTHISQFKKLQIAQAQRKDMMMATQFARYFTLCECFVNSKVYFGV